MRKNKKTDRDIYLTSKENKLDDKRAILAKISQENQKDDKRAILVSIDNRIQFHRTLGTVFSILSFVFLFFAALIYLRPILTKKTILPPPSEHHHISTHDLPPEEFWVINYHYRTDFEQGIVDDHSEDISFSEQWITAAGYHLIIGQHAFSLKNYETAIANLTRALEIFPKTKGVRGLLGTAYLYKKNFKKAAELLKEALEEGDDTAVLNNLGLAYLGLGKFDKAEKYLLRALELDPELPGCYKHLALLYKEENRPAKAVKSFMSYFSLYKKDLLTRKEFADYLVKIGKKEYAISFLKTASLYSEETKHAYCLMIARIEAQDANAVMAIETLRSIFPSLKTSDLVHQDFDKIRRTDGFIELKEEVKRNNTFLEIKRAQAK